MVSRKSQRSLGKLMSQWPLVREVHTVMERLLEEVSYSASDLALSVKESLIIDKSFVEKQLNDLAEDEDLSRYIL